MGKRGGRDYKGLSLVLGTPQSGNSDILAQRSDREEVQKALATPDMPDTALYFALPDAGLFDKIVHRYHSGAALPRADQPGTTSYGQEATQ